MCFTGGIKEKKELRIEEPRESISMVMIWDLNFNSKFYLGNGTKMEDSICYVILLGRE